MIPLPSWIDPEAWDAFVQMRREIKKPLTMRGAVQVLKRLQEIHDAGHDANDSLDQASDQRWQTVYAPQKLEIARPVVSDYEQTQRRLKAEAARKGTKPPPELRNILRRAA